MFNKSLVLEKLLQISEALRKIERRFSGIQSANDFLDSDQGEDMLDSICMVLIAVGESFKKIDDQTNGTLLSSYPDIDWKGVKGVRDFLSHHYFDINAEQIFYICQYELTPLQATVESMIRSIQNELK